MTINEAKRLAFRELNKRSRVLAPAAEAQVTFPEFDPCRAVEVIAVVKWPAIVNMREVTFSHVICDGDRC